uniref:(northern house mosquito) hypothetical protein n=1 Tax=Culex pipiens TaxID=7175 RepID=A0A8D8B2I3_CULPI
MRSPVVGTTSLTPWVAIPRRARGADLATATAAAETSSASTSRAIWTLPAVRLDQATTWCDTVTGWITPRTDRAPPILVVRCRTKSTSGSGSARTSPLASRGTATLAKRTKAGEVAREVDRLRADSSTMCKVGGENAF